jgi:two-component system NarL family response regulator
MQVTPEPGGDGRITVLVVDDHDLYRTGLASLLAASGQIEVVAQASGGRPAVRLAAELGPQVVLMDMRMPDLDGAAATRAILERVPEARVVMLTVASDQDDVTRALQAGACGFLLKEAPIEDVIVAIRAAAGGAAWLAPQAARALLQMLRAAPGEAAAADEGGLEALSPREIDVLRLVARGLENSEIAHELRISPSTVKNHVSSILTKLELPNRIQAAIYALRSGLD